jgi:hypothetical protein
MSDERSAIGDRRSVGATTVATIDHLIRDHGFRFRFNNIQKMFPSIHHDHSKARGLLVCRLFVCRSQPVALAHSHSPRPRTLPALASSSLSSPLLRSSAPSPPPLLPVPSAFGGLLLSTLAACQSSNKLGRRQIPGGMPPPPRPNSHAASCNIALQTSEVTWQKHRDVVEVVEVGAEAT